MTVALDHRRGCADSKVFGWEANRTSDLSDNDRVARLRDIGTSALMCGFAYTTVRGRSIGYIRYVEDEPEEAASSLAEPINRAPSLFAAERSPSVVAWA